ncbi:hypothetical protein NDU88_008218, partial [Pleurodeles waltl]
SQHKQRVSASSVSSLLQGRRDPLSVCAVIFIFRPSQTHPQTPDLHLPSPQPQEEERAWKWLHRFLL